MTDETPARTLTQAIRDLELILAWKKQLPTRPTRSSTITRTPPSTDTEDRLPFGLDQVANNIDNGYTGIRTPTGVDQYLATVAAWAATSGLTGTPSTLNPGSWLHSELTSPHEWEIWDDWESFAEDLAAARRHVGRLAGYSPQSVGLCPTCAGHVWAHATNKGISTTAHCNPCNTTWSIEELPTRRILTLRSITNEDIWITGQKAIEIWKPHLNRQTLVDWVRYGRISYRGSPREYALADINRLARDLIWRRK